MFSVLNALSKYAYFYLAKNITPTFFCLFFKSVKAFRVSLSRITNFQGLPFAAVFNKETIKANKDANCEYDRLRSEALFILPVLALPATSTYCSLNPLGNSPLI